MGGRSGRKGCREWIKLVSLLLMVLMEPLGRTCWVLLQGTQKATLASYALALSAHPVSQDLTRSQEIPSEGIDDPAGSHSESSQHLSASLALGIKSPARELGRRWRSHTETVTDSKTGGSCEIVIGS